LRVSFGTQEELAYAASGNTPASQFQCSPPTLTEGMAHLARGGAVSGFDDIGTPRAQFLA